MLSKVLRQASFVIAALVLTASFGLANSASAASITNTGPGSTNIISYGGSGGFSYKNNNNVHVGNNTNQNAHTGDATVGGGNECWSSCDKDQKNECDQPERNNWLKKKWNSACHVDDNWPNPCNVCSWNPCKSGHYGGNTNGGHAESGDAKNKSHTDVEVSLDNKNHKTQKNGSSWSPSASIKNTGPHSTNKIIFKSSNNVTIENENDVDVDNNTTQNASSGNATVSGNTNGGNATTGNASNYASTSTEVEVENSSLPAWHGSGGIGNATINTTGPGSLNKIYSNNNSNVSVSNNNTVSVSNNTTQNASSGNATVSGNTNGGNATTGNASNHASTSTTVSISN